MVRVAVSSALALALAVLSQFPLNSQALAQKYGGTLQVLITNSPDSLSIHEGSPINSVSMSAAYSNLVFFDPLVAQETLETIVPELAESWSWNAAKTALTFRLRQGVRWHDGKPFTSADVKKTFDVVRGASTERLKLNPRKAWYANVAEVATNGDHEVTFKLKRAQPSLIAMLATGSSPVMAAHFPVADWRTKVLGTGPFALKEYLRDKSMDYVRNRDYFVKGRPYLEGVRMNIIQSRGTMTAAYVSGQLEVATYSVVGKPFMESVKQGTDQVLFHEVVGTLAQYVMFNPKKPPFDNAKLRLAMSAALDRNAFSKSVLQGGLAIAGTLTPPPIGAWGQSVEELANVPGYGDTTKGKKEARRIMCELGYGPDKPLEAEIPSNTVKGKEERRIMCELGYGPDKPLKVEILSNTVPIVTDFSVWTAGALKDVYVDATLRQTEPSVFRGALARRDFQIIAYSGTNGSDDPDIAFYEHYGCGSLRSYNDYCNPVLQKKFDEQSQMFDNAARLKLVREIDTALLNDAPRAIMGFRINYFPTWPYVKNFIPHQSNGNFWRFQEVWLDK